MRTTNHPIKHYVTLTVKKPGTTYEVTVEFDDFIEWENPEPLNYSEQDVVAFAAAKVSKELRLEDPFQIRFKRVRWETTSE